MSTIFNKILLIIFTIFFSIQLYAGKIKVDDKDSQLRISKNTYSKLAFTTSFSEINTLKVNTSEGIFYELSIDAYGKSNEIGNPKLPVLHKIIETPVGSKVKIKIINYSVKEINLSDYNINFPLIPVQPSIPKVENIKIDFKYNKSIYKQNDFYSNELVSVEKIGIMRGVNLSRLNVSPIQYNPVTNTIKIYNNISVELEFENGDIHKTISLKENGFSPYFNSLNSQILNYKTLGAGSKDSISKYPIKYVIVADPMFQSTLQPFVLWKTKKGFNVIEAYTNNPNVGTTTTTIKTFLDSIYNAGTISDPPQTFVLFVGDVAQIPSFSGSQTTGSHVSDLYYCEYTGDTIPDAFYGRFSAINTSQLTAQIDKTLQYEQYLFPDSSFLNETVLIAGNDAVNAPIYGNGQVNYGSTNYFNSSHGLTSHVYLYPGSSSSSSQIIQNVNSGTCFVNYTAHGNTTGWSDPSFSVYTISSLTNQNKYPLMIGNACLTNKYDVNECFGEALLRASNKGAIGYIGAANLSYWDEDYYWAVGVGTISPNPTYSGTTLGAYDKLFHDHGEPFSDWFVTQGQIVFAGNLAVTQSGSSYTNYYWEIYCLMGDPSLMTYFSVPQAISASYNQYIPTGLQTFTVTTDPYAYVAISLNGVLHGAALADTNGTAIVPIIPFSNVDTADIVITKQNKKPYFGTVNIAIPNGPYIVHKNHYVNDNSGNNNGKADFGENISLDVTLENITNFNASMLTAKLTSSDPYITITDSIANWGNISANDTLKKDSAFSFTINNFIPDQHFAFFYIEVEDSAATTWNSSFLVILNAPLFKIVKLVIDDNLSGNANGKLDPGETAQVKITTLNIGHSDADNVTGLLISTNNLITVNDTFSINPLSIGATVDATFNVSVDNSAWNGMITGFDYSITSGYYNKQKIYPYMLGVIDEDFETSNFLKYNWMFGGNLPWIVIDSSIVNDSNIFEGKYSAKSGLIADLQTSELSIEMNVITDDSISFYKKVSCEEGFGSEYDYLEFLIDNNTIAKWDGEIDWSRQAYLVSPGQHTFKWVYHKDGYYYEGSDCVWIDYIVFPQNSLLSSINDKKIVEDFNLNIYPNPSKGFVNINFELNENSPVSIRIYNMNGQFSDVLKNESSLSKGKHEFSVDLSSLANGVYFIILNTKNNTSVKKLILY